MNRTSLSKKARSAPIYLALSPSMRYYCGVLLSTPQFLLTGVAGATQETAPKLTVGPDTYSDHCEYWANIIYDPNVWTVTCYDDTVVVTPFAPPLGGL